MKDTDFEKKSRDHAERKIWVAGFLGGMENHDLIFETHSPGFSNIGKMPGYTKEQEKEFNDRYLKYLRGFADKLEDYQNFPKIDKESCPEK